MTMPDATTLTIIQLALSTGILLLLISVATSLRQVYAQLGKTRLHTQLVAQRLEHDQF
jgi:hypothetical protein